MCLVCTDQQKNYPKNSVNNLGGKKFQLLDRQTKNMIIQNLTDTSILLINFVRFSFFIVLYFLICLLSPFDVEHLLVLFNLLKVKYNLFLKLL